MNLDSFTPQQRQSVTHLDGPLLICAGAGSGKTFTLTQRIAWALMPGSGKDESAYLESVDQALVITFTNKAAGEIKSRVRNTLRANGLVDEALKVDSAWISTIHGMCQRILREHALELGMDPAFQMATETQQEDALQQAISLVVGHMSLASGAKGVAEITELADAGVSADATSEMDGLQSLLDEYRTEKVETMLRQILTAASHQTLGLDALSLGPEPPSVGAITRALISECEEAAAQANEQNAARINELLGKLYGTLSQSNESMEDFAAILNQVETGKMRQACCKDLVARINQAREEACLALALPSCADMMALARRVDAIYHETLREQALVDMSDLIRLTLKAFTEHPQFAEAYKLRFRLVMVDEFQDTSQMQIDLIEQLTGQANHALCTVGDSQQSIYRFQGADVNVYLQHKCDMCSEQVGAQSVELHDNFRSHGDVLAFVRAVCGQADYFAEDFLDLQPKRDEQALVDSGRNYKGNTARIELVLASGKASQAELVEAEAQHIAQRFKELERAGHTASQMVLLLGKTTHIDTFASALRAAGLPCVVAGGSGFFAFPVVLACQSLLRAIANPLDSESLIDVLSSQVMPVSSDDLLQLSTVTRQGESIVSRQNPGEAFLDATRMPAKRSALLDHAINVLQRAWKRIGKMPPSRVFSDAVAESGWLGRLQHGGASEQADAANILKFIRLIAEAEVNAGYDMARISSIMQASATRAQKPGALSTDGNDAVRIMTVHASKGLEFPIVAIADCYEAKSSKPGNTGDTLLASSQQGRVFISLRPADSKAYKAATFAARELSPHNLAAATTPATLRESIMHVNYESDCAERRRLFYVAATRASEALIVSMSHKTTKTDEFAGVQNDIQQALFPEGFPQDSSDVAYGGSEPLRFTRINVAPDDAAVDNNTASAENCPGGDTSANAFDVENHDFNQQPQTIDIPLLKPMDQSRFVIADNREGFFSYSSLSRAIEDAPGDTACQKEINPPLVDHTIVTPDADKATDFGSALHRVCEWIALHEKLPDAADIKQATIRFASTYRIVDVNRLYQAVSAWYESDVCKQAFEFDHHQPEVPFFQRVGNDVMEGSIDLLCWNGSIDESSPADALIIDYKTGGSEFESREQLQAKHLLQAQCYAVASLSRGFSSIHAVFVRVEQKDEADPTQPQTIRYEFAGDTLATLQKHVSSLKKQVSNPD